ncbi:helix-turn-helix protein [Anaerospora hongkongensis]|uniref:Helix-turn-helix protein n=1 Tax=Anaerospora hongkongensis TaxID=244830 RepID=A0A4R1Q8R3_9FIRM|nr:helix-turn-helix transcriptional regulator [Anaerospora hongkongensis]TCL38781.1 helix-turn-helix protein [Anaerospora hongkongensis]
MIKPQYALRLAELRSARGLTQQQLADLTGLTRGRLNNYEQGTREPDLVTLQSLADFFQVTTDFLLGRTDTTGDFTAETMSKIDQALDEDPELLAFWLETKKRPDLQLFLKQVKSASPKAIRQMMTIIKMIEEEESDES